MKLALRKLRGELTPAPGELILKPADAATRERRDIANLAVSQGPDAFLRAAGEITTIVTSDDPTLDDLLAFEFVKLQLAGKPLPQAAAAFARYAGLAREGLRPSSVPLDQSLEGIYLAIRNAHGGDLAQPLAFSRFEGDWQRMAGHLLGAAGSGADPFKVSLFADAPEFARERTFLAKDHDVYLQDVLRGERWLIRIPGGPPSASALILRNPKSLLWKHWSRADQGAPTGDLYLLLGVDFGSGNWVFSTDPVQRLPIKELADRLQAAELAQNPQAAGNSWFDGAPFGHTLVAAPKGGSKLSNEALLKVVKAWCQATAPKAKKPQSAAPVGLLVGAACVAALAALGAIFGPMIWGNPQVQDPVAGGNTPEVKEIDFRARGAVMDDEEIERLRSQGLQIEGHALIVAVGSSSYGKLPAAVPDAGRLYCLLRDKFGYKPENMRLLVDEPERCLDSKTGKPLKNEGMPTRQNVSKALEDMSKLTGRYEKGDRTNFVFYYAGHGETEKRASDIGYLILSGYWESDRSAPDVQAYNMGHLSRDIREKIHSTHQVLLIDCCFSGFVTRTRGSYDQNPEKIYELWKSKAHAILTAGSEKQVAYEVGEQSVFSATLFRALGEGTKGMMADVNGDQIVTDAELAMYLRQEVPKIFDGTRRTQTPQYHRGTEGDDVGQFLFLPRP
ncbi:MAG: caspase family protein [Planctomycetaceae bacterium]|nr:caspase family protein [Planctomycetaceae bacterium]